MLPCIAILLSIFLLISSAKGDQSEQSLRSSGSFGGDTTFCRESAQRDKTNQHMDQKECVDSISHGEQFVYRDEIISVKLPVSLKSESRFTSDVEDETNSAFYSIIVAHVKYYQIKGEFEQAKMENERWRESWWMEHEKWRMENRKWRTDHGEWCALQKKRWMDNELKWVEQNKKLKRLWIKLQELYLRMNQRPDHLQDTAMPQIEHIISTTFHASTTLRQVVQLTRALAVND